MTDTNPGAELRAAARALRAAAAAAVEASGAGTWRARRQFPSQPDADFTDLWATGGQPLLRGGGKGRPPAYVHAPVGDYIALVDPTVGAVLADWLEAEATRLTSVAHPAWNDHLAPQGFAVARKINGSVQ
ncbi:hypothetical protein [Streptomyces sp. NPDC057910]|uniref:hypothetical protein n=1 Tax=Streptomyces sp. NPDC057910 TaxID=3346278 RepID=UPI0036EF4D38